MLCRERGLYSWKCEQGLFLGGLFRVNQEVYGCWNGNSILTCFCVSFLSFPFFFFFLAGDIIWEGRRIVWRGGCQGKLKRELEGAEQGSAVTRGL